MILHAGIARYLRFDSLDCGEFKNFSAVVETATWSSLSEPSNGVFRRSACLIGPPLPCRYSVCVPAPGRCAAALIVNCWSGSKVAHVHINMVVNRA